MENLNTSDLTRALEGIIQELEAVKPQTWIPNLQSQLSLIARLRAELSEQSSTIEKLKNDSEESQLHFEEKLAIAGKEKKVWTQEFVDAYEVRKKDCDEKITSLEGEVEALHKKLREADGTVENLSQRYRKLSDQYNDLSKVNLTSLERLKVFEQRIKELERGELNRITEAKSLQATITKQQIEYTKLANSLKDSQDEIKKISHERDNNALQLRKISSFTHVLEDGMAETLSVASLAAFALFSDCITVLKTCSKYGFSAKMLSIRVFKKT